MTAENPEGIFYARWEIRAFRSVERFSDYKKIKSRLLRTLNTERDANTLQGHIRLWWSLLTDKYSTPIIVICTVVLVLLTAALLIVALL